MRYTDPFIFVKALTGQVYNIEVGNEESVDDVKRKIEEKYGIPSSEQRLIFDGHQLEDGRTLRDYSIEWGSQLQLYMRFRGGGGEMLPFANVNNEKKLALSLKGLPWFRISAGLNIMGKCSNEHCASKNFIVFIPKGFGTFNMNKECNLATCPQCNEHVINVNNCAFFKTYYSITGCTQDGEEVKRLNLRSPDNEALSFNKIPGAAMNQYQSLTITTTSINSPTITKVESPITNQVKSPTTTQVNTQTATQPTKERCTLF